MTFGAGIGQVWGGTFVGVLARAGGGSKRSMIVLRRRIFEGTATVFTKVIGERE